MKNTKQLERHLKGVANHWRIEILSLVARKEGINLDQITEGVGGNIKTISEHVRRLQQAGLINKKYSGTNVLHTLSPYGKVFYKFLQTFSNS